MTDREQTIAFEHDLNALINRYRSEFSLSITSAIGVLEAKKWQIMQDYHESSTDEED